MTSVTPTIVYNLEAYAAVAEVYLLGWADPALPNAKRTDLGRKANEACRNLRGFARVFRIGRPRALLLPDASSRSPVITRPPCGQQTKAWPVRYGSECPTKRR